MRLVTLAIALLTAVILSGTAPPKSADARLPSVKLELADGLVVEPIAVKWIEGRWQHAHDRSQRIDIRRDRTGAYIMMATEDGEQVRLTVFKVGCHRFVEMRSFDEKRPGQTFAVLSGYSERLSLDVLPAVFPDAWRDKSLIAAVGERDDVQEVPTAKREQALAWLAGRIDEIGTLMSQDMTYFRPRESKE